MKGSPAILARTIALGGLPGGLLGGLLGRSVGRSVGYDVGAGIRDHRATIHVLLRGAYRADRHQTFTLRAQHEQSQALRAQKPQKLARHHSSKSFPGCWR